VRIRIVDAFAEEPFTGNPAGVCLLEAWPEDAWMQRVAAELHLSETAFAHPRPDGDWALRWFTPTVEVDLCGHATLASAHALWEDGHLASDAPARFHTRSGLLTARREGTRIVLDFPAKHAVAEPLRADLTSALGASEVRWSGRNAFDYLLELSDEGAVRALAPDHGALARLPVRGVIVTARAETGRPYDFVSRFFAPGSGIAEDPVTGSSHCALAPYWVERIGRNPLVGYQASARGGTVGVEVAGDRVRLSGTAVTVLRAQLLA
jgi:PhzF family phenazine biosynthesis protein